MNSKIIAALSKSPTFKTLIENQGELKGKKITFEDLGGKKFEGILEEMKLDRDILEIIFIWDPKGQKKLKRVMRVRKNLVIRVNPKSKSITFYDVTIFLTKGGNNGKEC